MHLTIQFVFAVVYHWVMKNISKIAIGDKDPPQKKNGQPQFMVCSESCKYNNNKKKDTFNSMDSLKGTYCNQFTTIPTAIITAACFTFFFVPLLLLLVLLLLSIEYKIFY